MAGRMSFPVFSPQEDGHAFDLRTLTSFVPATNLALLCTAPSSLLGDITSKEQEEKQHLEVWK